MRRPRLSRAARDYFVILKSTFYESIKFDGLVKSRHSRSFVIPAQAGIQEIQRHTEWLTTVFS